MKSKEQTELLLFRATERVSRVKHYKGEPGCYFFQWRGQDGDLRTTPTDSEAATRNARRRKIIETASIIGHCDIASLHPAGMGGTYRKLAQAMGRAERAADNPEVPQPKWQWSEKSRKKASERATARHALRRQREALASNESERPAITAARLEMERATATAYSRLPGSITPAARASFALWIAAGPCC